MEILPDKLKEYNWNIELKTRKADLKRIEEPKIISLRSDKYMFCGNRTNFRYDKQTRQLEDSGK